MCDNSVVFKAWTKIDGAVLPPAGEIVQAEMQGWAHAYTKFMLEGNWKRMESCMKAHLSCLLLCGLCRGRTLLWKQNIHHALYVYFYHSTARLKTQRPHSRKLNPCITDDIIKLLNEIAVPVDRGAFQQDGITQRDHAAGQRTHWRASIVSEQSRSQRPAGAAAGCLHTFYLNGMVLKGPQMLHLLKENWMYANVS